MSGRPLIAVVDDDLSVRRALGRLLVSAGFEAVLFASGGECLDTMPPARCFLIDIHLEGLDGFQTCERLRAAGALAPVILMTAHDTRETRARAMTVTNGAYLRKPFQAAQLLALVRALVQNEEPPSGLGLRRAESPG
jgi:DNA-binding response OmpR family regulator